MNVPIIDVIKIKNPDATYTVKLYHAHSVYTEVNFSHVAFAADLAEQYFAEMTSKMHRDAAVDFSEIADYTPEFKAAQGPTTDGSVVTYPDGTSYDFAAPPQIEVISVTITPEAEQIKVEEVATHSFEYAAPVEEPAPVFAGVDFSSTSEEVAFATLVEEPLAEPAPVEEANIPVEEPVIEAPVVEEANNPVEEPALEAYTEQVEAGVLPPEDEATTPATGKKGRRK